MLDYNNLNAFLHLCYLPKYSTNIIDPIIKNQKEFVAKKKWAQRASINQLVEEGSILLKKIFDQLIPDNVNNHIVYISGGLDSRAILAHLVNAGLKKNITAVTYGIPGTYDFEIGKYLAKFSGVDSISINLDDEVVTQNQLRQTCLSGGAWTDLYGSYYNRIAVNMCGNKVIYWSGYLGGELAGSHYFLGYENLDWASSKKIYWNYNKWEKHNDFYLTDDSFNFNSVLPGRPFIEDSQLISYPEQMDFCIRQYAWIRKTIVSIADHVITPYAHPGWVMFMLAIPNELRLNCELYRMILAKTYPNYYMIPTKNLSGKPLVEKTLFRKTLNRILKRIEQDIIITNDKSGLNYIDFNEAFCSRNDFIKVAEQCIINSPVLKEIDWINSEQVFKKHNKRELFSYRTIIALISLHISASTSADGVCSV